MNKIYVIILILAVMFSADFQTARADSLVLPNGNIVNGKINFLIDGLAEIKTQSGTNRICREVSPDQARDIVEIGYFKKKKISGFIYYLDNDNIEIQTASGKVVINRIWVRNIILSQENVDAASQN